MLARPRLVPTLICLLSIWILGPGFSLAQTPAAQSRIVQSVNESALVTLRGNTHPLAQPQFDRGAAPPDLPMARMLLVLQRSAAQEAALQILLDGQQDRNSPSYHQWLTPDAFGQQFGPSDQDIQTITAWLQSHGFQVASVGRGRTTIEFSGTALQVLQAFHTEIHKYVVNGQEHWANSSDPQIPAALGPVVAGVVSLNNFSKQPMHRVAGIFSRSRITGQTHALNSEFTLPDSYFCRISGNCYLVGPYDFAKIYNLLPLWSESPAIDGTGQSIAIVGISNINVQDVRDFRNLFGLPANDPQIIVNGTDPGLIPDGETEADLDVEWSGAVAKGATIKLVVSASTNGIDAVDLSALYVVENQVAPVVNESFGTCELFLGTAGNAFENAIREQGAAEGITFTTSSGDQGSAQCDGYMGTVPQPASMGLAVNGLASSPYGVAVGGTDFANFGQNFNAGVASPYWNQTNDMNQASAIGYIPETTWNSSCTNSVFVTLRYGANAEAVCNNPQASYWVFTEGGSGGKSNCTVSDGASASSCTGHYAKPSWQSAPGVPADAARDLPDVSLFASPGFMDSAYIVCEADQVNGSSCSLNGLDSTFLGVGGTSASAPAFAGMMALVNQYTNSAGQGNANYVLYKLASLQSQRILNCNASGSPASGCIFNDVTAGTIAMPCETGSPNCSISNGADSYGVLSGYNAGTGYDLATGLGSVNAYNMVHNWILPSNPTSTTLTINNGNPVSLTHGQSLPLKVAVTPASATGDVSLIGSPGGSGSLPMGTLTLQNGAANGNTATLAGGNTYAVKAHYAGDGTYAPSDSSPVNVTVAPEPSKTLISIPVFDSSTGRETGDTPASLVYGSPYIARIDIGNAAAAVTFPMNPVCAALSCPTGSITLADSWNGGPQTPFGPGAFSLNGSGYAEYQSIQLLGGSHQLSSTYAGDASYNPSSGNYNLMVTPAPTQASIPSLAGPLVAGSQVFFGADISTNVYLGAEPTGTISFYDGASLIPGTVTLGGAAGTSNSPATFYGNITTTFSTSGTHQITAKYSGDANYAAATSLPASVSVQYPTTAAESADSTSVNFGSTVTVTATVTSTFKSPPMTGTFQFVAFSAIPSPPPTLSTDANGDQVLTARVTASLPNSNFIAMTYSGDSNYQSTSASIFINVILPDFSMGTAAPGFSITAGQSGSTQLTLTPLNNIASSVSLSCNTPLAGATCSFNPAGPLSLSNGVADSTMVTIATLPPSSSLSTSNVRLLPSSSRPPSPTGLWMITLADVLAILICFFFAIKRRHRLAIRLGLAGLLCLVLGCGTGNTGGGGGGTPSPTSVTLNSSAVKVPTGTNVIFTATVNSSEPVTGLIDLLSSGGAIATAPVVNGAATFQITYLPVGTSVVSARYDGDSNHQSSTTVGAINEVITGNTSVFVIASSPQISHTSQLAVTFQ